MSVPLLIAAFLNLSVMFGMSLQIRTRYRSSLTSVEEKSAGMLYFYRNALFALFRGNLSPAGLQALAHYLSLHLLVPLLGLGFLLRSDGNFVVIVLAMFASMQLYQRVFPGPGRRLG